MTASQYFLQNVSEKAYGLTVDESDKFKFSFVYILFDEAG